MWPTGPIHEVVDTPSPSLVQHHSLQSYHIVKNHHNPNIQDLALVLVIEIGKSVQEVVYRHTNLCSYRIVRRPIEV